MAKKQNFELIYPFGEVSGEQELEAFSFVRDKITRLFRGVESLGVEGFFLRGIAT